MTTKQTATLAKYILLLVQEHEKTNAHNLTPEDRLLLVNWINDLIPKIINKYIRGAKHHITTLVDRVTFDDVDHELIDALAYNRAMRQKLIATMQKASLT